MALPARLFGVLLSPRAAYAAIAARPRWFGALAFAVGVGALATFVFLSTQVGQQAMFDQQIKGMESFGFKVTDRQYERMEQGMRFAKYTGPIGQVVAFTIGSLITAGILLGIFNALLGGDARFKQVYAIVAHSYVILTISQIFGLSLGYARETMSGATNLAVFFPFLGETSLAARFLGAIDLFLTWWIVSLSIGLGVLYTKRTGPIATTLLGIYVVIALAIALIRTALAGA
ncbi:MAG TPA: YIP1 family protein [Vicinamibacterales bacterium]|nr:YIP1 family protein [Vicinamibacterales bacterium]